MDNVADATSYDLWRGIVAGVKSSGQKGIFSMQQGKKARMSSVCLRQEMLLRNVLQSKTLIFLHKFLNLVQFSI
jgi:hypothetical protein